LVNRVKTWLKRVFKWLFLTFISFLLFFIILEIFFPINLDKANDCSRVLLDRDGRYLYSTLNSTQKWRFRSNVKKIDPLLLKMLLNYEDKRFYHHFGVDFLALFRATFQLITNGHITSGASTITMQLARLLEPKRRTISSKIIEIFRSFQLELHYSKEQILNAYLTLAPYGGNVEGITTASMRYFGKLPTSLTISEDAILTSLPQNPEKNRPKKGNYYTKKARDKVLLRALNANIIDKNQYKIATSSKIETKIYPFARFAPHLSQKILRDNFKNELQTTIYLPLQQSLEEWAKRVSIKLPRGATLSIIVANNTNGEILAYLGNQDIFNRKISGFIDMTQAIRSPGSVLKPLIYAIGFSEHIIDTNTIIVDKQSRFNNYQPHNFNKKYNGEVTIAYALQNSLNIPAVKVLSKITPNKFIETLQKGVGKVIIPKNRVTLPVALGGLGITQFQVTQLFTIIANGGSAKSLHYLKNSRVKDINLLPKEATKKVTNILREVVPPNGFYTNNNFFAYKTGTSYGYRDFWSAIYSKKYTATILVAKPDNTPLIKSSARDIAAPLSFEVMSIVKSLLPHSSWIEKSTSTTTIKPPSTLKRLEESKKEEAYFDFLYPKENSKFQSASCNRVSVEFKLKGGKEPFVWYIDGKPLSLTSRYIIQKFDAGAHTISVIDSSGSNIIRDIWVNMPDCDSN